MFLGTDYTDLYEYALLGVQVNSHARIYPHALKGQKLLAQGNRPGLDNNQQSRPVRAKALYIAMYFKAFALTGRLVCAIRLPRALPWEGTEKGTQF